MAEESAANRFRLGPSKELVDLAAGLTQMGMEGFAPNDARMTLNNGLHIIDEAERRDPLVRQLTRELEEAGYDDADFETMALALVKKGWHQ